MKSIFGNNIKISLFGESHQEYVGLTIDGLKPGIEIDFDFIDEEIKRRQPQKKYETSRIENDEYKFVSGVFNCFTDGSPLTVIIKNNNVDSSSYPKGIIRPGHSDYPAYVRSKGYNDYRGGGHFSGRLTLPIVIAGAICKKMLEKKKIKISSEIINIGGYTKLDSIDHFIKNLIENFDSCGGMIRTKAINVPVGVGEPFFDSVESVLAHLFFSIPSVKGVSFGDLDIYNKLGSTVTDEISYVNKKIKVLSNHNGGINGGLTNGNPIICNVSFKPISSIGIKQNSVNVLDKENIELKVNGRYDVFILDRVMVVCEAMMAIGLYDLMIDYEKDL